MENVKTASEIELDGAGVAGASDTFDNTKNAEGVTGGVAVGAGTAGAQDEMSLDDLAEICESRANTYGLLSRLFMSEVDDALLAELTAMNYPVSTGNAKMDEGYYQIAKYLSNAWVDPIMKLAVDFSKTFLGAGIDTHSAAYPFESVYTSEKRLLMQAARDEVLAIYRANRLDKSDSWKVGEDHIAVELEFMRILNTRAAQSLRKGDEDAAFDLFKTQENFMNDHILCWTPLFADDIKQFAGTQFYVGLANLMDGFLEEDSVFVAELLSAPEAEQAAE
jgi:TorA maturation chaperone TorD